jgi:hypothetical protein
MAMFASPERSVRMLSLETRLLLTATDEENYTWSTNATE